MESESWWSGVAFYAIYICDAQHIRTAATVATTEWERIYINMIFEKGARCGEEECAMHKNERHIFRNGNVKIVYYWLQ